MEDALARHAVLAACAAISRLAGVATGAALLGTVLFSGAGMGASSVIASDTFTRTSGAGWGRADNGGGYSYSPANGRLSVANGLGTIALTRAGANAAAWLGGVVVSDVDLRFRVRVAKVPRGSNVAVYSLARKTHTDEIRSRLIFKPTGAVAIGVAAVVGGRVSQLASNVLPPGLTFAPGKDLWLRTLVTGKYPATIKVKAWRDGGTEPDWQLTARTSAASLQVAGAVGVQGYAGIGTTNAPATVSVDMFSATSATTPTPSPNQTPTPTPSPTPDPTPDPTAEPTATITPDPTPDATATPEVTPNPTLDSTPTPEPSPIAAPDPTPDASPAPDPTPDASPTPDPTPDPTPEPTATVTPDPTPDVTPTPEVTPDPTPDSTPTPSPTPSPIPTPSPTPTSSPGVYFVAPNARVGAAGTIDDPWDVAFAVQNAPPGSTVYVRGGTYDFLNITASGSPTAITRILAYPGEQPVIDGSRVALLYSVSLSRVSYLELSGFVIQGGYGAGQSGGGVLVDSVSHVVLSNNTIRNNHSFGVRVFNGTDVVVENNDIYGNAIGVQLFGRGTDVVVRDNDLHDNDQMAVNTSDKSGDDVGGEGLAIVNSTGNVVVENNRVWGNRAVSYDYGYDGSAFSIYASSNWTIRSNTTWDNRNILETGTDAQRTPCDNGQFVRNLNYGATTIDRTVGVILRCSSNTLVANNTFVGMQFFVFDISNFTGTFGGSIDGLRVVNNIVSVSTGKIYGIESVLPSTVVLDYDLLYNSGTGYFGTIRGTGYRTFASFASALGQEQHGIAADPLFSSAQTNDYSLSSGSPAIDSGTPILGLTDVFTGAAPDRGYLERPATP